MKDSTSQYFPMYNLNIQIIQLNVDARKVSNHESSKFLLDSMRKIQVRNLIVQDPHDLSSLKRFFYTICCMIDDSTERGINILFQFVANLR